MAVRIMGVPEVMAELLVQVEAVEKMVEVAAPMVV